jgi:hypothetical protein
VEWSPWRKGNIVQSINLAWFFKLANALRPLTVGGFDSENYLEILGAIRPYLGVLRDKSSFPLSIDASRPFVWGIEQDIEAIFQAETSDQLSEFEARRFSIQDNAFRLAMILDSDLGHQPAFHVFPKRAYDVNILISDATLVFSPLVRDGLNEEERFNLNEAGRCLAFEVSTAAGFHIFRALDSILQRYVRIVRGSLPKNRNWGQYIKALEDNGVDRKITGVLFQIKEFHRNPVVHPDERLDSESALSLVGIAESALSMMMADMEARSPSRSSLNDRDAFGLPPEQ